MKSDIGYKDYSFFAGALVGTAGAFWATYYVLEEHVPEQYRRPATLVACLATMGVLAFTDCTHFGSSSKLGNALTPKYLKKRRLKKFSSIAFEFSRSDLAKKVSKTFQDISHSNSDVVDSCDFRRLVRRAYHSINDESYTNRRNEAHNNLEIIAKELDTYTI